MLGLLMAPLRSLALSLVLVLTASLLGGCGPIMSTVGIVRAEKVLQEAVAAGSDEKAPYPTELARNLLGKAREEQGYSSYDVSTDLAEQAQTLATEALAICREGGGVAPVVSAPAEPVSQPSETKALSSDQAVTPVEEDLPMGPEQPEGGQQAETPSEAQPESETPSEAQPEAQPEPEPEPEAEPEPEPEAVPADGPRESEETP